MTSAHPGSRVESSRHTLDNGLRVVLMRREGLPILSVTALLRVGVISERPHEAGLAGFTAGLLPLGTTRRSAVELANHVDSLGASLGLHSDYDYSLVGVSSLSRDAVEAVGILSEVLTSPAFEPEEVERRRNDILGQLERRKDNPHERVREAFIQRIYGFHPYRHPASGYPETVVAITPDDLRRFYTEFYRPNNTILAIVGEFEPGEMLRLVEASFSSWTAAEVPHRETPPIPAASGLTVERIQKDGMTQATVRVGGLGLRRESPDHVAAQVLNFILGGSGFGSRLMKELREERGLTYGVHTSFHSRREPGYFVATFQTGLDTMNAALEVLLREIERMRESGVTAAEVDWARRFFSGSLPLSLETNDQLATRILEREFYDLEEDFWLRDIDRMRELPVEAVNDLARRLLDLRRFTVVCLADFRKGDLVVPDPWSGVTSPPAQGGDATA